jgi:hypothetical protein
MKNFLTLVLMMTCFGFVRAQTWTAEQLNKANTAKDIAYLSEIEREAILYINLARLYPKEFVKYEVANYYGAEGFGDELKNSPYRQSLISHLNAVEPTNALAFDESLYNYARCFAKEQGEDGSIGHNRKSCEDGYFAECCSYGMDNGKDIALQWLIDDGVESLGHRENCLNPEYTKIGLSFHSHTEWNYCCVADMI